MTNAPSKLHPESALPRWDRQAWICLLITCAVLFPRGWMITRAHSECLDADDHLRRGLAVLLGERDQFTMYFNDPPLGQIILALPMLVTGSLPEHPINLKNWPPGISVPGERQAGETPATPERARFERLVRKHVIYGHAWSPGALLELIAVWKTALFVPAVLLVFQWCRALYGLRGAWLTMVVVLGDPTIAAHIPIAAIDSFGVEGILFACFCFWRYFENESKWGLVLAAVSCAAAMLIKHTAVILPGVFLVFAAYYWVIRPLREGMTWPALRVTLASRRSTLAAILLIGWLAMWAFLFFDFSIPAEQFRGLSMPKPTGVLSQILDNFLHRRWPTGEYIGCFVSGLLTSRMGQPALLFGQISKTGWWYYFPAMMTLKVPLGFWLVLALAIVSLWYRPPSIGEISILIPLIMWLAMFTMTHINYGFRHFMPPYVFMLMFAGRCVAGCGRSMKAAAWIGAITGALHAASFHPDYLSYVNFPRHRIWMQMTDSNIDWAQAMKQIGRWVDAHPGRTVFVVPAAARAGFDGPYYLGDRVQFVEHGKTPPQHGILIISPIWLCGVYDEQLVVKPYDYLKSREPIDMVGHSMLVFDLDKNP